MPFITHTRCVLSRDPAAPHDFHPTSGWCTYGCGNRADGRTIHPTSARVLVPGPEYTHEQLAAIAAGMTAFETTADDTITLWSEE